MVRVNAYYTVRCIIGFVQIYPQVSGTIHVPRSSTLELCFYVINTSRWVWKNNYSQTIICRIILKLSLARLTNSNSLFQSLCLTLLFSVMLFLSCYLYLTVSLSHYLTLSYFMLKFCVWKFNILSSFLFSLRINLDKKHEWLSWLHKSLWISTSQPVGHDPVRFWIMVC